ncbi:P-loop NTPase fold protein [Spiroplasma endosymbiont of Polydrusus pterygomalis]|uniref:P-loop NTPase fold protein n=1 Tax=Spiroplasma endosymbiont of Polydrusus pterygomalis TaxID=3139327 RepID=UPI003CCB44B7
MIDYNIYYTLTHHDFSHTIGYKVTKQISSLNDKIDNWVQKIKNNIKEEIVVIFDDLDRCTSDNQIIFLERLQFLEP